MGSINLLAGSGAVVRTFACKIGEVGAFQGLTLHLVMVTSYIQFTPTTCECVK